MEYRIPVGLNALQQEFVVALEPLIRYASAVDNIARALSLDASDAESLDTSLIERTCVQLRSLSYNSEASQLSAMSTTYRAGLWAREKLEALQCSKAREKEASTAQKGFWMQAGLPERLKRVATALENAPNLEMEAGDIQRATCVTMSAIRREYPRHREWIERHIESPRRGVYRLVSGSHSPNSHNKITVISQ